MNVIYSHRVTEVLKNRLNEPRRTIQIVLGPRQVGKSTAVRDVLKQHTGPVVYALADQSMPLGSEWIARHWAEARGQVQKNERVILALDEIQKVPGWTSDVKRLWDEDTYNERDIHVILTGSSALTLQKGLSESLLGRFEVIWMPHWSFEECRAAFGWGLEDYFFFGGYPGAVAYCQDEDRWRNYMMTSMIEPVLTRDIALLTTVHNPALLRRLFFLACEYTAQELSYRKIQGIFQDVSNPVTIVAYQRMLEQSFLIAGLQKWSGGALQKRNSSPKWLSLNTGLVTAIQNKNRAELKTDPVFRGRLVETSIGAHLFNQSMLYNFEVYYWREGNMEIDFILRKGNKLIAMEVKSGFDSDTRAFTVFLRKYPRARVMLVGGQGMPIEAFLTTPVKSLFEAM